MRIHRILIGIFFLYLLSGPVYARTANPLLLAQADAVTFADLGVEDPGLLPTNPFYFFKEFGRTIRRVFTFNPVSKAELELKIVNEKVAELKKVEELDGKNSEAIADAIRNYRDAQERLREKFESLRETSQNPNIDKLIEKFSERFVQHEKIFDELSLKFDKNEEIKNLAESAKGVLEQTAIAAAEKDDPEKFAGKIGKFLDAGRDGELKNIQSSEITGRLREKASDEIKKELDILHEGFSAKAREDIKNLLEKKTVPELENVLKEIPLESQKKAEFGAKIFEKQKIELETGPVRPEAVEIKISSEANLKAEAVVCGQLTKNLDELWDLFKSGKVTEQEYAQKYEILKKQSAGCEAVKELEIRASSTPASVIKAGDVIICTEQYDPVCGTNNKTYSNECHLKADGGVAQYKGECK